MCYTSTIIPADRRAFYAKDVDCVNVFQPYFWLIFDDPVALNRLPEENAQITLHVADLPWSDGNVGLEEMMRGLGLPTTDAHHGALHPRPPKTETEPSGNTNDAPPEGYKMLDVRVERARTSLLPSYPHTYSYIAYTITPFLPSIDPTIQTMALVRSSCANAPFLRPTKTKTNYPNLPKPGSPLTASLPNLRVVHTPRISSAHAKSGANSRPRPRAKMTTTPSQRQ